MAKRRSELDPERDRPRLDRVDRARRSAPALAAIESGGRAARHPDRRPRQRDACSSVLAGGRRRIVEVGTAYRLLDAVDGTGPAAGRHDRDHRPGPIADRSGPWLVARGRHRRRTDHRRHGSGPRGVRSAANRRWPGRSTWRSSTPSSRNTRRTSRRSSRGSRREPWSSPTTSCGAAGVSGARPVRTTTRTRLRSGRSTRRSSPILRFNATILPVGDGLLVASWRG